MKLFLIILFIFIAYLCKSQRVYLIENKGLSYVDSTKVKKIKSIGYFTKKLTVKEISALNKAKVKYFLDTNFTQHNTLITYNDYRHSYTANFYKGLINWDVYKRKGITGKGVKLAVLDTGVDTLAVPVDRFKDFTESQSGIYGKHGTAISSVIKSVLGIANGVELHAVKIFGTNANGDHTFPSLSNILLGLQYCIDSNISVVAISSNWGFNTLIETALQSLTNTGAVVFSSSGNSSAENVIVYPASSIYVHAVNAYSSGYSNVDRYPFKNYMPYGNTKGISFAIGGYPNEHVQTLGVNNLQANLSTSSWGTSISSCFMAAIFALKKEELGLNVSNKVVLQHIINNCVNKNIGSGYGVPIL